MVKSNATSKLNKLHFFGGWGGGVGGWGVGGGAWTRVNNTWTATQVRSYEIYESTKVNLGAKKACIYYLKFVQEPKKSIHNEE